MQTLRMLRRSRGELHGYVFTDQAHARQWLSQSFVEGAYRADITLETVEVGEPKPCPRCGSYREPVIKPTGGRMTVDEFLGSR